MSRESLRLCVIFSAHPGAELGRVLDDDLVSASEEQRQISWGGEWDAWGLRPSSAPNMFWVELERV